MSEAPPRYVAVRDAIVIDRLSKRYRRPDPEPTGEPSRFAWLRPGRSDGVMIDEPIEDADDVEADDEVEPEEEHPVTGEVWALRDITLRVVEGSTVGLIGPNGAGKSTLLKVLARITTPTTGRAMLRGRAAPLLSVASSLLQDDRTARENILLLARFFDAPVDVAHAQMEEIIGFAELDDAADLPVRRYSTGLKRRLAFSAVLNLKPDILLADEILSVGDAGFKRRCLERVAEATQSGLTTLFASHDLKLVRSLCDRVVWMDGGVIVADGETAEVVDRYERHAAGAARSAAPAQKEEEETLENVVAEPSEPAPEQPSGTGARPAFATQIRRVEGPGEGPPRSFNAHVAILLVRSTTSDGIPFETFPDGVTVRLELSLEVATPCEVAGSFVLTRDGRPHLRLVQPEGFSVTAAGFYTAAVEIPAALLGPGGYGVKTGLWVVTRKGHESVLVRRRGLRFEIAGTRASDEEPLESAVERTDLAWTVERVTR